MENEHLCLSWSGTRFEVVRREYFSCVLQPCFNLTSDKMWTNTACLKRLPSTDYVYVMIDRDARALALYPCQQNAKDALRWCSNLGGKRKPRQISCRFFSAMLFDWMGWNPACQYKVLGTHLVGGNGEALLFDLTSAYSGSSQKPCFPLDWKDSFGLPTEEHRRRLRPCLFKEYTVWEECPAFPQPMEDPRTSLLKEGEDA